MQQNAIDKDLLTSTVALMTGLHRTPADDPSFYEIKDDVRSHLRACIDEPFFFAVEAGEEPDEPASFVLGVGNDIRRVSI